MNANFIQESLRFSMASVELAGFLETSFLLISTIPGPCFAWAPIASLFLRLMRGDVHSLYSENGLLWLVLNLFLLRATLVISILWHEFAHLLAALFTSEGQCDIFSWKNLMGNSAGSLWLRALLPFSSWPRFVPYIELGHVPSAKNSRLISMAGPTMSILLAIVCTKIAFVNSGVQSLKTIALGTLTIAIGCLASDVFSMEAVSKRFRCGNFGMLVICAMDR
jgi:hypothetical protein